VARIGGRSRIAQQQIEMHMPSRFVKGRIGTDGGGLGVYVEGGVLFTDGGTIADEVGCGPHVIRVNAPAKAETTSARVFRPSPTGAGNFKVLDAAVSPFLVLHRSLLWTNTDG